MASRSLSDLIPMVARAAAAHISLCRNAGIEIIDYCTWRSTKEQSELYSRGRTRPGPIVTYAQAGKSFHQYRVARDVVPVANGKALWKNDELWERVGRLGEAVGFEWAGRWKRFNEKPHFQVAVGLAVDEIRVMTIDEIETVARNWYDDTGLIKTIELAENNFAKKVEVNL